MRRRRKKREYNQDLETKKIIYISLSIVLLTIITFITTYVIYSKALSNRAEVADITELATTYDNNISEASSSIGKSVNQVKEEKDTEIDRIAINTSSIIKKEEENNDVKEATPTTANVKSEKKDEKVADPTFIKPVEGEIIREFANEGLVYSETLKEWVTHVGIDIKAERATLVKASADGTIKYIKNDPRYGITVVMEHVNGFTSVYSNLFTTEFVKEGEKIKQGQTIGTVGNTAVFEIMDEPHLHFEILKNNENLNPNDYIR